MKEGRTNGLRRILHLRDSGGLFGGERVILTLARNLDRSLFDLRLVCMDRGDGRSLRLMEAARACGIAVEGLDVRGRFDPGAIRGLRKLIVERGVELVHTHDFKSDFYALAACRGLGVKLVSTAHGSTRDSLMKRLYLAFNERLVYRGFDRVIAVSEDLRARLASGPLDPGRICLISNGLDPGLLDVCEDGCREEPLPTRPPGARLFAVIGRLYPDKGHVYFLEAFASLALEFPDVCGLIVGEGPARAHIEEHIRSLGIEGRVSCCGVRKDMKRVYASIDFLVVPSLTEGLPYVMLEAMACGVPVVATSVGDIPLLVQDRVTGFLVSPGDAPALAQRMRELLVDGKAARAMARAGRRLVLRRFSAAGMAKKTAEIYLSLLDG